MVIIVAVVLPLRIRHPSDFILWLFFVVAGAPCILLPQYMKTLSVEESTKLGLAVTGCMIFIRVLVSLCPLQGKGNLPRVPASTVWLFMVMIALAVYAVLFATVGLGSVHWLALYDVYEVRSDFRTQTSTVPVIGYLLPVVYNVINPAFIARGIYSLKATWIAAGVGGQVLIYVTTGQKSILFSALAIVGTAWLFRRDLRLRGARLLTAMSVVAFASIALDWLFHTFLWNTMLIRRFLVIPGFLTVAYVNVFQNRPRGDFAGMPLFWVERSSDYGRGPSYLVGQILTGNPLNNANVSLFGHGYYNYGYLGMFIESLVFVLLLWFVDAACRGLPTPVVALIFFMPTFAAASSNIFTTITSHGFLAAILICTVLPRTGWGRQTKSPELRPSPQMSVELRVQ